MRIFITESRRRLLHRLFPRKGSAKHRLVPYCERSLSQEPVNQGSEGWVIVETTIAGECEKSNHIILMKLQTQANTIQKGSFAKKRAT